MTIRLPHFISNGNKWLEAQQVSILSAASVITAAVFLSSLTGLLRNRLLVTTFFKTTELQQQLEAYWVSFRLPELVFQLLVIGALSAAFIPIFTKYEKQSKDQAFRMASSVLNLILLGFLAFSALVFIFAVPLTRLMTGGEFSAEQVMLSANMTRLMLLAQFFFAISNFLSGTIQSYKRFIIPALSPIAYNIGIIVGTVMLSPYFGIYGPTIGVVLGAFLHFVLQLPLARKLGFHYYPLIDFAHPGVKEIFRMMVPRTLTLSINQIQLFAIVFFATHLGGVSLTIINLAQQLMTFPIRIFGAPIGQAALPFLSKESNDGELDRFKGLVLRSLHQISFFAMPASVLLLILRIPIVRLAYGAREFPWQATLLTGWVVAILALSVTAQAMIHILIRAFYALHDTKNPLRVSLVTTGIFLAISSISAYSTSWGLVGLATALSISTTVEMLALLFILNGKVKGFTQSELWIPQLKMLVSSFLMAIFIWLPFRTLDELVFDTSRTVDLIGLTLTVGTIGMLTYTAFAVLLEVKELYMIQKVFGVIGNWQKSLSKTTEVVETAGQSDESTV